MTIEWYPGHMGKAKLQIAELIRNVDVVIEVLDARLPASSSNKLLEELRRNKPCIKVMNKNDLADPAVTKAWVRAFEKQNGIRALPLSAKQYREVNQLTRLCLSSGAQPRQAREIAACHGRRHSERRQVDPDQHPGGKVHGQGRRQTRHHHLRAADRPAQRHRPLRHAGTALARHERPGRGLSAGEQRRHRGRRPRLHQRGALCRRIHDAALSGTAHGAVTGSPTCPTAPPPCSNRSVAASVASPPAEQSTCTAPPKPFCASSGPGK